MTADELKQYIIENNKIHEILESLECFSIQEYKKEFRCGLPNDYNKSRISVKKETLSTKVYQSGDKVIKGDIFVLIMFIKEISFGKANKYLHDLFKMPFNINKNKNKDSSEEVKKDPLHIFKKVRKKRHIINKDDIEIYDDNIIKEYIPLGHIDWIREGIMPFTCERFAIGYSCDKKRIVIPWRYWCGDENDYVGIMGRTVIPHHDLMDVPKYFPLKPFLKSMNIYGLQENYQSIQESGYVVVYESEKSTLKRHSRKDNTGVSIGSHDLSDEQVKILISLNVDVIIAFDKDVTLNHIRETCDKFYGIRNIFYIYDKYDLLKEKESPADASNKIFQYLFKYKVKYDETERNELLKWREKQAKN